MTKPITPFMQPLLQSSVPYTHLKPYADTYLNVARSRCLNACISRFASKPSLWLGISDGPPLVALVGLRVPGRGGCETSSAPLISEEMLGIVVAELAVAVGAGC